jgi:hypothetical protein
VFGMGTGDPSQYGHRQTYDGAWRVVARSLFAASSLSRMVSPGPNRNANCNLAPKNFARLELIATKLIGSTRLGKKSIRITARS